MEEIKTEEQKLADSPEVPQEIQTPNVPWIQEKHLLPTSVVLGAIIIAASIIYGAIIVKNAGLGLIKPSANQQQSGTSTPLSISQRPDQPTIGKTDAPVTMIEFADFQCPYCQQFHQDAYQTIKSKYIDTGKVKLVFEHFPLSIHQNAQVASEAAECANKQGKFSVYYDKLFTKGQADGTGLDAASLKKYAKDIGLDTAQFNQCLDSGETASVVGQDESVGLAAGVQGTPTFFINGTQVVGARSASVFEQVIQEALKK